MTAILGLVKNNGDGDYEELKSMLGTYGVIFFINLLLEIMMGGGAAAMTGIILLDALIESAFITFVLYASNKGIKWRESREE